MELPETNVCEIRHCGGI